MKWRLDVIVMPGNRAWLWKAGRKNKKEGNCRKRTRLEARKSRKSWECVLCMAVMREQRNKRPGRNDRSSYELTEAHTML